MATSMISSLLRSVGRISQPILRLTTTRNFQWSAKRFVQTLKAKNLTVAGTGLGISYSLFGISFGWGKKEEEEEPDKLTLKYREARLAHSRQDLQKAEDLYHECLQLSKAMLKSKEITEDKHITALTLMYDGLADIALQTGKIEVAESLFKETLKGCLQQKMAQDHNVIVGISLKLASIYAMQGKKMEAEQGYMFCMISQESKMAEQEKEWVAEDKAAKNKYKVDISKETIESSEQDTAVLMGMALGSYGRFLLYEKRYQEALPLFERARVYAKNTLGVDTNQYVILLNDLATLYIVTKNFDKAEDLLKKGLAIVEKADLSESPVLMCSMGALYLRKGMYIEAAEHCSKAVELSKKYNHSLAYKNGESCLKKVASVMTK